MPKFSFTCDNCHQEIQLTVSQSVHSSICPNCKSPTRRLLPKLNGSPRVNEVVDKYMGVVHQDNQTDSIKIRKAEYFWTVEVPRFVESGVYSIETMLENQWVTLDEKGQIKVNNVPPHRR